LDCIFGVINIPLQRARNYDAWLPSAIFPKYGNVVEREKKLVNRLQRVTKRGKFKRAPWKFDVVLNSSHWEIPKQTIIQIYITSLQYVLNLGLR